MSRELRRVPPNFQHPKEEKYNSMRGAYEERLKPLFDGLEYPASAAKFIEALKKNNMDLEKDHQGRGHASES